MSAGTAGAARTAASASAARVAVGTFSYEGNSFSIRRDGRDAFARVLLAEGDAMLPHMRGSGTALAGGVQTLQRAGLSILPLLAAKGVSGGGVVDAFYVEIRDDLIARLRAMMPVDGVYLALHGAMICETMADPEGDLLTAVRAVVGARIPIAASLDLHAHVTPAMVGAADILVGYERYPHIDAFTTGQRAAQLLADTIAGTIRPVMRLRRINAILPVLGGSTEGDAPMAAVRAAARAIEQSGEALSVSYFPVQPWIDYPDVGIAGLAITDGDPEGAQRVATRIVDAMWTRRQDFEIPLRSADDAVRHGLTLSAPTVLLVDATDSVGGGACGDSPILLNALLRTAPDVDSAVCLVDAPAARAAHEAGVGARLDLAIGATLDARFHEPVRVAVTVDRLGDGRFVYAGGPTAGSTGAMGLSAVLRVGGLRIVVASHPFYEFGCEHYACLGIDIHRLRLVSFKNLMNFRTLLGPSTDWVGIDGPGATPPRLQGLHWQRKLRPFWPCDDLAEPQYLD